MKRIPLTRTSRNQKDSLSGNSRNPEFRSWTTVDLEKQKNPPRSFMFLRDTGKP